MNPLYIFTAGRAWNHDSALLFALLAFVIHCHALRQIRPGKWLFLGGLSLGIAAGIRLSFAFCFIPFLIAIWLYGRSIEHRKIYLLLSFISGFLLSMLPSLITFIYAPKQFLFGNIYYAKLNTIYRQAEGHQKAMTIIGKLKYLGKDVVSKPGNLLLCFAFIYFVLTPYIKSFRKRISNRFEVLFVLILLPFLLLASLAPTPTWYQYYYALVPFALLGILYEISYSHNASKNKHVFLGIFVVITLISCVYGIPKYKHIKNVFKYHEWYPIKAHRLGITIAGAVNEGKVLTLAPILALEGGLEIYEELTTGPFAWRTARFLSEGNRKEFRMISADDLYDLLEDRPPKGVLVGFEPENLEKPLVDYAKDKGYLSRKLGRRELWVTYE